MSLSLASLLGALLDGYRAMPVTWLFFVHVPSCLIVLICFFVELVILLVREKLHFSFVRYFASTNCQLQTAGENRIHEMEKLPSEIMLDILSRLPYETMINCKLVSKSWRDITSDIKIGFIFQFDKSASLKLCYGGGEHITTMQGHYSHKTLMEIDHHRSVELEPVYGMVGSCNGLVCFWIKEKSPRGRDPIFICNPITGEYVYLPKISYNNACNGKRKIYIKSGFGYHPSTDEYKVVRIYYDFEECIEGQIVQVYTLGSGHGWRDVGRISYQFRYYSSVCANGVLYWKITKKRLVAFNLANEKFQLIPCPPLSPKRSYNVVYIQLLFGGYLSVVHIDVGKEDRCIHVWTLEKMKMFSSCYDMRGHDFNDLWGWSKKFSIPAAWGARYYPFAVTKSNQVLMSSDESVYCYDLGTKALTKLWDDCPMRNCLVIPHVNSLVALEALGEKFKRGEKSKRGGR